MSGTLRLILGDQLTPSVAALQDGDRSADVVLLAEVASEATYVRHHKQKIALIFAAMRGFADELRAGGWRVRYVALDDPANTGDLRGEVARALKDEGLRSVVATESGEHRLEADMAGWSDALGAPVEIREDDRFICSRAEFAEWADGRKGLRMEFFYREMRRKTGLLMDGNDPVGGQWNYDAENRKKLPKDFVPPEAWAPEPNATVDAVLALVETRFAGHFGDLRPFNWGTTRAEAEAAFEDFVIRRLSQFGDYQDAMAEGEETLFHSLISAYLNIGLLDPVAVCARAEKAWRDGHAPINAVEGFIRQILGWREYVRGIYFLKGPDYGESNALDAHRPLPDFYWTGDTDMACLAAAIGQTQRRAYAHHIQRLMVTGLFALLIGARPKEVCEWYLAVYIDAFEWVELPNTHGMALYADGGVLASKPYAASGKYIDRMSDHCKGCAYNVKDTLGPKACPLNALYWDFIARHEPRLGKNPRTAQPVRTWNRFDDEKRAAIRAQAGRFLDQLDPQRAAA
ncbi:MAG: cryptochrome/photolyase family protein [Pseudomonadota bacterium]